METQLGLYLDPDSGRRISTHSMLKTFRRCPKQADYKYHQRLKPRRLSKPLEQGKWMHALLEAHYKGNDWRDEHQRWTTRFSDLFDEEKERLGDLPRECARMMRSYLWHYKADEWKVHEIEFVLETEFPDGTIYRGKIDLLIENQWGLWIVDHKWNKSLPNMEFRILDSQSALYIWAAVRCGIPVQGHIWNYGRRKAASIPKLLKDGTRLSRSAIDTDYPTFVSALKKYELDPKPYRAQLDYLKSLRYEPGTPQRSPFFRRDVLEKTPAMLKQVAREAHHTSKRMHTYPFDRAEFVERVPDKSCTFMCSYTDICSAELFVGSDTTTGNLRRQNFKEADPMDYYHDEKEWDEDGRAR